MLVAVYDLKFTKEACESSFEPLLNYLFVQLVVQSYGLPLYMNTFAIVFFSEFAPQDLMLRIMDKMASTAMCGDEMLLTPDIIDSESVHIQSGENNKSKPGKEMRPSEWDDKTSCLCVSSSSLSGDVTYITLLFLSIFITLLIVAALTILSINFHNPALKVAGVPEMIVFSSLLIFKLWFSLLLMTDPENQESICYLRHLSLVLGLTGTSSLLFFRLVRFVFVCVWGGEAG